MRSLSKFVAVLVIAFAFSACKKSSTPAPDTTTSTIMTLTSNGTNISFDDCEEVTASVNNVVHTLISGNSTTNKNISFTVDIVHDPATIKAGQAYPVISTSSQTADAATLFYSPNATDTYVSQLANSQGSVTINGVTATTITGTFSGVLFAEGDFETVVYTITNGAFTAKRN
ncbi:hypothetical protein ACPPVU_00055 [Mucilaginibacter sp. McL0603]|uniref:hypothetical protein n=1 Tax=Mucilaginibacter sp. McL0603 TaxID=3415670 RepID=UPI003CE76012